MSPANESTSSTLFVRNIPEDTDQANFEALFSEIGPLKRCFLVRAPDQKCKGIGYVTYALAEHAAAAVNRPMLLKKKKLLVKISHKKSVVQARNNRADPKSTKHCRKPIGNKNARLIIRNLSFKCNEKNLREEFGKFGNLQEVSIAKKPDGKMRGFAFIQFEETDSASKAIEERNAQPLLGRPIAIDWAVPKDTYEALSQTKETETPDDDKPDTADAIENLESEDVDSTDKDAQDGSDSDEGDSSDTDDGDDEVPHKKHLGSDKKTKGTASAKKFKDDVEEGRTVFVRNLPFDMEEDELNEAFSKYGDVKYCKICIDKLTEHPKGTAFIQFKEKEQAETCLDKCREDHEDGGMVLEGRRVYANLALSRSRVLEINEEKSKKKNMGKDKRNLYLAREGLIRTGTDAAVGVAPADLTKRMNLESRKRRLLKDLKMFISKTRLAIYNLPPNVNDKQLRIIFLNAAGDKNARLSEARVMRDIGKVEGEKLGKSKGHGFVEFTEHEHALQALRHVNNNPELFGETKRPIVEFSVENMDAIKTREKRLQKSKEKNKPSRQAASKRKMKGTKNKADSSFSKKTKFTEPRENLEAGTPKKFMGMVGVKDGKTKGMKMLPSHSGPKIRHKRRPNANNVKTKPTEKPKKIKRKFVDENVEKNAEPKKKRQKNKSKGLQDDKSFNKLITQYRNKLSSKLSTGFSKSKWFEDS